MPRPGHDLTPISFVPASIAINRFQRPQPLLAQGASFVVNQVRVMKAAPESAQALAASLNVSVCNVGIGFGVIVGGRAVDLFGIGRVDYVAAAIGLTALAIATGTGLAIRSP